MSKEDDLRRSISDTLRLSYRTRMKFEDGEFFPSEVFDEQARAVMRLIKDDLEKAWMYEELTH